MEGLLGVIVSFVVPLFEGGSPVEFCGSSEAGSGLACGSVGEACEELGGAPVTPVLGLSPVLDVVLSRSPAVLDEGTLPGDEVSPPVVELVLLSAFRRFCTAEPALC